MGEDILFLAPNILSLAGMDKDAVLIATALGGGLVTIATLFLCQRLLFLWSLIRLHLVILLLLHVSIHFGWSLAAPCR